MLHKSTKISPGDQLTLGFLIHVFWAGWKSPIFQIWAAPAAPQTIPAGVAQTPKIEDPRPAQNHVSKTPASESEIVDLVLRCLSIDPPG